MAIEYYSRRCLDNLKKLKVRLIKTIDSIDEFEKSFEDKRERAKKRYKS